MSQRRTSLSFPLGILPILFLFDCSAETRNWDAGPIAGNFGRVGGAAGAPALEAAGNWASGRPGTVEQNGGAGGSGAEAGAFVSQAGNGAEAGASNLAVTAGSGGAAAGIGVAQAGSGVVDGGRGPQAGSGLGRSGNGASGEGSLPGGAGPLQTGGTQAAGSPPSGGALGQAGSPPASAGVPAAGGSPPSCTNNFQCDDGDACNGVETCSSGVCVSGTLPSACVGMDAANCKCTRVGTACGIQGLDADGDGVKTRKCTADPGLDCNDGDASITYNACNGCAALAGAPGGVCGSCGSSRWACSGTEAVVCNTPSPAPKQCGTTPVVEVCTAGAWITETTCAAPTPVCVVDAGVPKCGACDTAGITRCKSGVTNVVETCAANRLSWTDSTCSGSNACFYFGANDYRCSLCQPGTTKCKSASVMQTCNAAGTGWTDKTCGSSSACYYSSGVSMFGCFVQLLPGDLQNEIDFDRAQPQERFDYRGKDAVGLQPFLDQASGFALA